jgi:tetratricopeptide (TPR) repeat protein
MSNKTSNQLFELIHSLNKSEKRYFKLYASRHTIGEQNNYVILFDYIAELSEYDEEKLFKHFKNKPFLNQFSTTKSRLYQLILKSLDLFHSNGSVDAQLFTTIHSADILFNKGLYKQSEKLYNQAEKQAEKHQKLNLILEIREKQKKLFEKEMYCNLTESDITQLYKYEQHINKQVDIYNNLWQIKSLLFIKINKIGSVRTVKEKNDLDKIIEGAKLINIDSCTNKVKYLYHHTFSTYYFTVCDFEQAYLHLNENFKLIESDTHFIKQNFNSYFSVLTNLIYVCTKLEYFEEANKCLSLLKTLPNSKHYDNSVDLNIKYYSSKFSLKLFLHMKQNNYSKAEEIILLIEQFYKKYEEKINGIRKAYLDFKIATIYLTQNNLESALKWVNLIINNKNLDKRQDIYSFAKIIHLIIHFELKNYRYLSYALSSTKRYLKDKKRVYKFEELFLKVISKISKEHINQFDLEEILLPYVDTLKVLKQDSFEKTAFDYFDFYTWVNSKINGKTYLELKLAEKSC